MSLFSETMAKAISEYRLLLRRYLNQVERMTKLQKLRLRDSDIFKNDLALYQVGNAIIADIEAHMMIPDKGYYSYSGIKQFCEFLKDYLSHYRVEGDQVVHRAQKASRALLDAIQLAGLPREKLSETITTQLFECNKTIVDNGSEEQCELQMQLLARQQAQNPGFYTRIIAHLESLLHSRETQQAQAA
ncbi:MAG: hypothetical protein COY58_03175 [Gammaproteobacteria bacterium CG_4_10_14_0_8_um_filter_38_16]|nr:MAG: hypothetical protein COY58_03175 [Gammaproteobacteria bacterium CG_4_10_14_0_8_um_filter_38_16]PJA03928.1 MAG: hypothetical protein COX72_03335 [Gammaproteobacteria bacterium CG_4_10_14_0_2_um_filter_38_22]PJB09745.1 MAG: hypothetical protein CO120_08555 [Gammaproteobacteria bacterium CG_4_9_14_3_um_filter_38_9]